MPKNDLLITTSGCSGGSGGPHGVYHCLQQFLTGYNVSVMPVKTIPKSVDKNVKKITDLILKNLDNYQDFYLAGWSMGGATAVQVAYKINNELKIDRVKGIVLLATQTDGAQPLRDLKIPVIFYHGREDNTIPFWNNEGTYDKYKSKKRIFVVESLGHEFTENVNTFAQHISANMADLFFQGCSTNDTTDNSNDVIAVDLFSQCAEKHERESIKRTTFGKVAKRIANFFTASLSS